jgi:hypothetical protein
MDKINIVFGMRYFVKREMPTRESEEKDHNHLVWYKREIETIDTKSASPTTFSSLRSDAKKEG